MNRDRAIERLRGHIDRWDIVVIGGGATGVAVALDAASRGFDVVLVEQSDFGKGTSSRSTKLIHGGVRYLRQGDIGLVREALRERRLLAENAPQLVRDLTFLIPCRSWWQRFFYGLGLKIYDLLAAGDAFGRSRGVSTAAAGELVPTINPDRLRGGVIYHDGQFDDARLLICMLRRAVEQGACAINYAEATRVIQSEQGKIEGVEIVDGESGERLTIQARAVVNAAGPFCDQVRRLDQPNAAPMLAPSQGVHLVLPRCFFPGNVAMIVPRTSDGRVMFVIPWHDRALVGTTDTAIEQVSLEPRATNQEIEFLLRTCGEYLSTPPQRGDVLSVFTGIRPLVRKDASSGTASLSRDHVIDVAPSGLITITGGKWTTARHMGEACVDRVIELAGLPARRCATRDLQLQCIAGNDDPEPQFNRAPSRRVDSAEPSERIAGAGPEPATTGRPAAPSPQLARRLHRSLAIRGVDVIRAVRFEMARSVDDVLARRTRSLFLDARAAVEIAPEVARLIAGELNRDARWEQEQLDAFGRIAEGYLPPEPSPEASQLTSHQEADDRSDQQADRNRDRQGDGDR